MQPGLLSVQKSRPRKNTNYRKTSRYGAAQDPVRRDHGVKEERDQRLETRIYSVTAENGLQVEAGKGRGRTSKYQQEERTK